MFNLTEEACQKITEMIDNGYEFMLTFDDSSGARIWEADFTRLLKDGYDNHEPGQHPTDPSTAVVNAYENHKAGKRCRYKCEDELPEL